MIQLRAAAWGLMLWVGMGAGAGLGFQAAGDQGVATPTRVVGVEYPRLANLGRVQGTVELKAIVLPDGAVKSVEIVRGNALLEKAAAASVGRWLFACPGGRSGCEAAVVIEFELVAEDCAGEACRTGFEVDLPGRVRVRAKQLPALVD